MIENILLRLYFSMNFDIVLPHLFMSDDDFLNTHVLFVQIKH